MYKKIIAIEDYLSDKRPLSEQVQDFKSVTYLTFDHVVLSNRYDYNIITIGQIVRYYSKLGILMAVQDGEIYYVNPVILH